MPLSGNASGKAGLQLSEAELSDARVGHLDEKALRIAMQNFQQLDRNNDGKLSREEFRSGMGMLGVDPTFSTIVFNSFDMGGDGWIDRREFLVTMAVMLHPDNLEDQIDLAFDAYDVNKDGKLVFDELRQVIASIFATMEQMGISDAGSDADAVAGELFRQMDRGGKGYVTKEDYVHLAKTQPELIKRVGLGGAGKEKRRSKRASAFLDHPPREKHRVGRQRVSGPRKRGTTVTFGSAKWELVVQMMLGIRLAVGRGAHTAGEPAFAAIAGSERSLSISESSVSASERSPREERSSSPRTPAAGAPGSSTQHTSGGGGGGGVGGPSPPTARLRSRASASCLDRSEPFTILINKGPDASTRLGVRVRNAKDAPGVVEVHEITPDGVAARSGMLREGDLLLAVNNVSVPTHQEASAALRAAEGEVKLKISGRIDADRLCVEVHKFTIPSHHRGQRCQSKDRAIHFKDYAPQVYRRIRALFGVAERDYMLSLGPEQILGELLLGTMGSLSELMSEGKSGSFFYYSNDALYMIKKIPKREMSSLRRLLPAYVQHVEAYPHTLLPRFMGAHRLIVPEIGKVHFVVFANVFSTDRTIHERYDLKGSTLGRTVGAKALSTKSDALRKDLDLKRQFDLGPSRAPLMRQLRADLAFLQKVQTMDYSLLFGIHFPRRTAGHAAHPPPSPTSPENSPAAAARAEMAVAATTAASPEQWSATKPRAEVLPLRSSAPGSASGGAAGAVNGGTGAGAGAAARAPQRPWPALADGGIEGRGAPSSAGEEGEPEVYYIGIIDILTSWSAAKSVENLVKKVRYPTEMAGISCVPPDQYAERFGNCLDTWISPEPSSSEPQPAATTPSATPV